MSGTIATPFRVDEVEADKDAKPGGRAPELVAAPKPANEPGREELIEEDAIFAGDEASEMVGDFGHGGR